MNKIKIILTAVFNVFVVGILSAQLANPATLETFNPEARSAGMGDIGSATTPDAFSQHWNVAKYAFAKDTAAVGLSYAMLMPMVDFKTNMVYAAGYYKIGKQAISASIRYMSDGSTEFRSIHEEPYNTMSLYQLAFDLGYSRSFGEYFSLGAAARFLSLPKVEEASANVYNTARTAAFAVDLGVYFRYPVRTDDELAFGLSLKDIGTKVNTGAANKQFLPMTMYLGGRYTLGLLEGHGLLFAAEVSKPLVPNNTDDSVIGGLFTSFGNNIKEWGASLGLEYNYQKRFFARGGYHFGSPNYSYAAGSYLSIGAGLVIWKKLSFDASYMISTSGISTMSNNVRATIQYAF